MRRACLLLLLAVLLLLTVPALADSYRFNQISMAVDVPRDAYTVQMTENSISTQADYLATIGETEESMRQRFADEGILLWAYDAQNARTLVITAVQDEQSRRIYDINELTAAERATYKANYTNGVFYSKSDYSFSDVNWQDFDKLYSGNQGRFLMLKYNRRQDGNIAYRGLWRCTVRNGYTIKLDLRVHGRQLSGKGKDGDITAMNTIQSTLSFMAEATTEDAPLSLSFTAPPPENAESDTFAVKGVTRPGAAVVAAYVSLRGNQSKQFRTTADSKGNFSVTVTLPSKDLYNLIISATDHEGFETEETVSQEFSVEYDPDKIQVNFTSPFPEVFTTDSFRLTGTTLTGVTIQLVVNNQLTTKKTGNNRTFSFTVDTSKEGDYEIQLTFTKKNYATKVMQFFIHREMDDNQRTQAIRDESKSPEYTRLAKSPKSYVDKTLRYTGYIIASEENGNEYINTLALQKNSSGTFKNYIIVLSDEPMAVDTSAKVTVYGTGTGSYSRLKEDGTEESFPRMSLLFAE